MLSITRSSVLSSERRKVLSNLHQKLMSSDFFGCKNGFRLYQNTINKPLN